MKVTITIDKPETCGECPFYVTGSWQDMGATIPYCDCRMGYMKSRYMLGRDCRDTLFEKCRLGEREETGNAEGKRLHRR